MRMPNTSLHEPLSPATDAVPVLRMSEEEFVAWCDEDTRAEWVAGEVIMMSPVNREHSDLVGWLVSLLRIFVEQRGLGQILSDVQIRFASQRRRRAPDILFVTADHLDRLGPSHVEGPPDLVIEIVSPDSEARDWREKYLEYQAAGVREYWVIDPASQHVEAYALGPAHAQAVVGAEYHRLEEKQGVIVSTVLSGLQVRIAWLWPQTRPKILEAARDLGLLDQ
jgi:Uma2 family endonuclease